MDRLHARERRVVCRKRGGWEKRRMPAACRRWRRGQGQGEKATGSVVGHGKGVSDAVEEGSAHGGRARAVMRRGGSCRRTPSRHVRSGPAPCDMRQGGENSSCPKPSRRARREAGVVPAHGLRSFTERSTRRNSSRRSGRGGEDSPGFAAGMATGQSSGLPRSISCFCARLSSTAY